MMAIIETQAGWGMAIPVNIDFNRLNLLLFKCLIMEVTDTPIVIGVIPVYEIVFYKFSDRHYCCPVGERFYFQGPERVQTFS